MIKHLIIIYIIMSIQVSLCSASDSLAVETSDGTFIYSLDDILICFTDCDDSDSLVVNTNTGTSVYCLSNIEQIMFSNENSVDEIDNSSIPDLFTLEAPFPNPFNLQANITLTVHKDSNIKVCVYNVNGREVSVLTESHYQPGKYQFTFDASHLSSGVYFVNAVMGGNTNIVRKMVLLK